VTQEGFDEFTFDLDDEWILDTAHFDALPFVFEGLADEPEPEDAEPQISRADELQQEWGTELGQLWRLPSRTEGQEHRLICGDCTDATVVERVMGGEKAGVTLTDPPYNVGKDYGEATDDGRADYAQWSLLWLGNCPSDCVVFTPGMVNLSMWYDLRRPRWLCSWRKSNQVSHSALGGFNTWEPLIVYGKQPKIVPHDSWDIPMRQEMDKINPEHPVAKTLVAWQEFVSDFTELKSIVYDPFSGSGTTIIAAENLSRQCRAVEISPGYVAVALQRYKDAFGIEPELIQQIQE
jgi:DNA modification methylase